MKLMPRKNHLGRVLQPRPPRLLLIEMKTLFTPALDIVLFLHRLASVPCPPTLANLAVLNRAVFPPRHPTDIRHQNMNTALGHQNIVLCHQATVLRHQATVLRHQATVLRHQPTVLRHQATLFHLAFLQFVAIHFGHFWKVRANSLFINSKCFGLVSANSEHSRDELGYFFNLSFSEILRYV